MYRMFASKERAPTRGADGVDIVVVEDEPVPGQRVDVRGRDLVGPVESNIVPALANKILTSIKAKGVTTTSTRGIFLNLSLLLLPSRRPQ